MAESTDAATEAESAESLGRKQPWVRTTWSGKPLWNCRACPWNTLDGEEAFMDHWTKAHQPKGRTSAILGRDGRPIVIRDEP